MTLAWRIEWTVALRRRRLFALDVAIPLFLVAPLVLADAPPVHEAAVVAVLLVLFGVFGSAIPLVRDGASGLVLRWTQAGVPPRGYLAGRVAAQALLDLVQLLPTLVVLLAAVSAPSPGWGVVLANACLALVAANALGAWAAAAARSLAEAALFSAVLALLLLHASGVFRTPSPGTAAALVERLAPFHGLHEALLAASDGGPFDPAPSEPLLTAATVGAPVLLTWFAAPFLLRLLARAKA